MWPFGSFSPFLGREFYHQCFFPMGICFSSGSATHLYFISVFSLFVHTWFLLTHCPLQLLHMFFRFYNLECIFFVSITFFFIHNFQFFSIFIAFFSVSRDVIYYGVKTIYFSVFMILLAKLLLISTIYFGMSELRTFLLITGLYFFLLSGIIPCLSIYGYTLFLCLLLFLLLVGLLFFLLQFFSGIITCITHFENIASISSPEYSKSS